MPKCDFNKHALNGFLKYYNKPSTTCDNDNVQSHDQEESKL